MTNLEVKNEEKHITLSGWFWLALGTVLVCSWCSLTYSATVKINNSSIQALWCYLLAWLFFTKLKRSSIQKNTLTAIRTSL